MFLQLKSKIFYYLIWRLIRSRILLKSQSWLKKFKILFYQNGRMMSKESKKWVFMVLSQHCWRLIQRVLALIYLAHASDVLENAFAPLSDEDYDVAMKRVRYLLGKASLVDPDIKKIISRFGPGGRSNETWRKWSSLGSCGSLHEIKITMTRTFPRIMCNFVL